MENLKSFLKSRKIALIISAIYVGIGTLAICNIAGSDFLYGDWVTPTIVLTFPVTFVSFIYRYVETDFLILVLIIQFIMFILTFLFLSLFIKDNFFKLNQKQ
jgi:hypothetical protein